MVIYRSLLLDGGASGRHGVCYCGVG